LPLAFRQAAKILNIWALTGISGSVRSLPKNKQIKGGRRVLVGFYLKPSGGEI
jgi:hypothetical protein